MTSLGTTYQVVSGALGVVEFFHNRGQPYQKI
jgi:hypothetical protein